MIDNNEVFSVPVTIPNDYFGIHYSVPILNPADKIAQITTAGWSSGKQAFFIIDSNPVSTKLVTRNLTYYGWPDYINYGFVVRWGRGFSSRGMEIYNAADNTTLIGVLDYVIDENHLMLKDPVVLTPYNPAYPMIGINYKNPYPAAVYDFSIIRGMNGPAGSWAGQNTARGVYNWISADAWLTWVESRNKQMIFMLYGTPVWAATAPHEPNGYWGSSLSNSPPLLMQDWVDYCTTVATRYKTRLTYFEVWNEPGFDAWHAIGYAGQSTLQIVDNWYQIADGQQITGVGIAANTTITKTAANGQNYITLSSPLTSNVDGDIKPVINTLIRNFTGTKGTSVVTVPIPVHFNGKLESLANWYLYDETGVVDTYTVASVNIANKSITLNEAMVVLNISDTGTNNLNWTISRAGTNYTIYSKNQTTRTITFNETIPAGTTTTGWVVTQQEPIVYKIQSSDAYNHLELTIEVPVTTIVNYVGNGTTSVTCNGTGFSVVEGTYFQIFGTVGTQQTKLNGWHQVTGIPTSTSFTFNVATAVTGTLTTGLGTHRKAISVENEQDLTGWIITRAGVNYSASGVIFGSWLSLHESIPFGTLNNSWTVTRTGYSNYVCTVVATVPYSITTTERLRTNLNSKSLKIITSYGYFTGSSEKLAEMTRLASQVIKSIIPTAKIISPAPSGIIHGFYNGNNSKGLARMLDSSAQGFTYGGTDGAGTKMKDWADIIGVHTYGGSNLTPHDTFKCRQELAKIGVPSSKEMWSTEFGAGADTTLDNCYFSGTISGTTLTVNSVSSGEVSVGDIIWGPNVTIFTQILSYGTGIGKTGTYIIDISHNITPATSMSTTYSYEYTVQDKIKTISRAILTTAFGGVARVCYYQYDDPHWGSIDPTVVAGVAANVNFVRGKTLAKLVDATKQGKPTGGFTATFTDGTSITV